MDEPLVTPISVSANRYSFFAVSVVITALLIFNINFYSQQVKLKGRIDLISWDVFGYYLYLPATFIYHDLAVKDEAWLNTLASTYQLSLYQVAGGSNGRKRIIYQSGLCYFYAPGFFVAHLLAKPLGYPADGLSPPYQYALLVTSLLVTFTGLFYLRKLLLCFFNDSISAVSILIICFGTNWFLTVGYAHGMPHSFLFTLNVLIIYFTHQWFASHQKKFAVLTGIAFAWAVNCRPTEIVWLLIPLLWNVTSWKIFIQKIRNFSACKVNVIAFIITVALCSLPQLAYWQYASNDILKINLHTERLSILSPYIIRFLFSYKKGWLLYTPLMLFAIGGFIPLYSNARRIFFAFLIFFIVNLWITSSWENWWYAASYGQRPMVETYGLMAIPLGYLLQQILKAKRSICISLLVLLTAVFAFSIFQSRQFYIGIIDSCRMTKDYYWRVFGKLTIEQEDFNLLEPDRGNEFKSDSVDFEIHRLLFYDFELNSTVKGNTLIPVGEADKNRCLKSDTINRKFIAYDKEHISITSKKYFWIRGSVKVFFKDSISALKSTVFVSTNPDPARSIKRSDYHPQFCKPGEWNTITFDYITPDFYHDSDKIKITFEYEGSSEVYIDDFKAEVWIPLKDY